MQTSRIKLIARVALLLCVASMIFMLTGCEEHIVGMLNPKGLIADEERKLFFDTLALMLIVVLPVIIMSFTFVYHYQASHRVRTYKPNWAHSYFLETLWWGIPCVIILVLAIITWKKTYELDPYRQIPGFTQPPMQIQAIALPWKWLFIYPEENIATVNEIYIPVGRQIEFWMTADNAPMSAFFIPQLGSQIYVMAGMRTRMHLVANQTGEFDGLNTLYNGGGFSDMHFNVHVVENDKMQQWIDQAKTSQPLTQLDYTGLLTPSINNSPQIFSGSPPNLFNDVIILYMHAVGPNHPRGNTFENPELKHH